MGEFGELLRNARAYRGVSLVDAERATRINRRYLAALEQEAFDQLPPLTYARGIVRIYAQYLGLDPVTVLAKFEEAHGQRSMGFRVVPAVRPVQEPLMHWAPNFAVIAFMLAISAIVFALVYTTYLAPRQQPTPTLLASTENTTPVPTVPPPLNVDTPEPINSPAVSPSPSPAASATPTAPLATTTPTAAPEETPPPSVESNPPPTPGARSGEHLFEIVTTGRVWVQATVDGHLVLAETLDAGARRTFRGQTLTVSSGNAPLVRVIVDGEDQGPLGQRWDQTATYP
ncbi:DUF4115 domain-containing protein [Thermomicrobium sp. CFH 73360]|uniref:helix-turn-helix domain-containing protein n=1 Tax=Thermomicrobium sp. CFH 73360 TaxID=2951987 RepID=UPI0020767E1F|nr:helix-turn-helix domain-containing protein [Thermomicrobium sp. CFH 73360]MCM8745634.1 DUF4115 domain-containing protein [Thermomicrobium sp. CFH 73360]